MGQDLIDIVSLMGIVFRDADPERALDALGWGVAIAQESGNRANETYLAMTLARIEAEPGDPLVALDNSPWQSVTTTMRATPP